MDGTHQINTTPLFELVSNTLVTDLDLVKQLLLQSCTCYFDIASVGVEFEEDSWERSLSETSIEL
jgi:hypothetical protein